MPYYGVVTRFTLEKGQSTKGVAFSRLEAKSIEKLDAASLQKMAGLAQVIGKALEREPAHREDVNSE